MVKGRVISKQAHFRSYGIRQIFDVDEEQIRTKTEPLGTSEVTGTNSPPPTITDRSVTKEGLDLAQNIRSNPILM